MTHRLTLLQQNDTHAHVEPHHELRWRDGRPETWAAGGAAHIRALADAIRREAGGACLHVDSGDAIHGTGPAQWTRGASVVPVLNAVGVELMTPGNWEFAFGPETLRERAEALDFPVIACNVHRASDGTPEFAPTAVRELGGLRVGFVGITSPIVGRTMPRAFGAGLRFADAEDALPETVARLRDAERPDLVVLVSHYGFAQEVEIACRVQGIDVILGGHTHDVLAEPVQVGRTIITQAGAHGSYLTRLDLEVANGRILDLRHALLPVRADGPTNGDVAAVIAETLRPHRERLDAVVGESRVLLHRGAVLESPMDDLITRAYLAATDADVALSHGWRYGTPIPPGPITEGDLWQMIPTNPELFTARLRGAELRRLLETSLERTFAGDLLRQQGGYVVRFAGMRALARLNNPAGTRLVQLEIGGAPVDAAREYVVAAAGEQSVPPGEQRAMTGIRAVDAVRRDLGQAGAFAGADGGPALVAV
ncbi:MAG: bifunctional metallophosphatase/5'-nucleotidase [Gemmatirosa sp.]